MSNVTIFGNTSGSVTLDAPAIAGTTTITLPNTSGTMAYVNATNFLPAYDGSQLINVNSTGNATTTTSAVDVTLTSSSNRVQNITMTAAGKNLILPDATTMPLGGPIFTIFNNGPYSFNIKTNGGYIIATSRPGDVFDFSLISKSTSNGLWADTTRGLAKLGYITQSAPNLTFYGGGQYWPNIANRWSAYPATLSSSSIIISWESAANTISAVVSTLSGTTWSFGAVVTVSTVAAAEASRVVALSATTGFIFVNETSSNLYAYPFSISGTTITIGTKSATMGTVDLYSAVSLSSTTAFVHTAGNLRIVYYNGTSAPTLGTAYTTATPNTTGTATLANATFGISISTRATSANFQYNTFTISNTTITSVATANISTTQASFVGDVGAYAYAPDNTSVTFVMMNSALGTNAMFRLVQFTSATYSISGTTLTLGSTEPMQYAINSMPDSVPPSFGRIHSSSTSAIGILSTNFVNSNFTDFDLETVIPYNYDPSAGYTPSGIPLKFNGYTVYNGCNLSSTQYVITLTNNAVNDGNYSSGVPGGFYPSYNGTGWYLALVNTMS